jgi:hypothetical protein
MKPIWLKVLILVPLTAGPLQSQEPAVLLSRAIDAQGGADRLTAARAMIWTGAASIHLPTRDIHISGLWRVQPPDSAIVATWETERGESSTRRLILAGSRGWSERDGEFAAMDPGMLAEERHQFYLYDLLRLVPLLDHGVTLVSVPRDSLGHPGFLVRRPERPDATLYFDKAGRVAAISTVFAARDSSRADSQEIILNGTVESNGIRWFQTMSIRRAGRPYFDLRLTSFRTEPVLADSLLEGPH